LRCRKKTGKARTAAMRESAGTTDRGDMALTTKRKRRGERDIDRDDMEKKMIGEVIDTDHDEVKTVMLKATSTAHRGLWMVKIVPMVDKGRNAITHLTMNTIEDGTTANTGGRINREAATKHTIGREKTSVRVAIDEQTDNKAPIAIYRHMLTVGSCQMSDLACWTKSPFDSMHKTPLRAK